jgi:hypothetical protein
MLYQVYVPGRKKLVKETRSLREAHVYAVAKGGGIRVKRRKEPNRSIVFSGILEYNDPIEEIL